MGSQKNLRDTSRELVQEQEAPLDGQEEVSRADEMPPEESHAQRESPATGQEGVAPQASLKCRRTTADSLEALEAKIGELGIHHAQACIHVTPPRYVPVVIPLACLPCQGSSWALPKGWSSGCPSD